MKLANIKRKLLSSLAVIALSFLTVFGLWKFSDEPNSRNNGFKRIFSQDSIIVLNEISITKNIKEIAGIVYDSLFLSGSDLEQILLLHLPTGKLETRSFLPKNTIANRYSKSTRLQVDTNGFTVFNGAAKSIFLISKNYKLHASYHVKNPFTKGVRFSSKSVALRIIKREIRDQLLCHYDLERGTLLNEKQITELFGDVGLTTDGFLGCDPNGRCIYVTRYANHIYLLDSDMNIIQKKHTIDTFSNYTIKSRLVKKGKSGTITSDGPPNFINRAITIDNGKLYINSNVKADNENYTQFLECNVIDEYDISSLNYLKSYHLPTENKRRIRSFKVKDGVFYVLYHDALVVYSKDKKDKLLSKR